MEARINALEQAQQQSDDDTRAVFAELQSVNERLDSLQHDVSTVRDEQRDVQQRLGNIESLLQTLIQRLSD